MRREKTTAKREPGIFGVYFRLLPGVFAASPGLFAVILLLYLSLGLSISIGTVVQQRFFDEAVLLVTGDTGWGRVLSALALMGFVSIASELLNAVVNCLPPMYTQKVSGCLAMRVYRKTARLSPVLFEDTGRLDDINKAEQGKNNAVRFVLALTTILTCYIPTFLFIGWYLFTLKPILAIAVVLIFVPTLAAQLLRTRVFTKLEDKSAPLRREQGYYENCIVGREYFKETRLLGGFSYFRAQFMRLFETIQRLQFRARLKSDLAEGSMRLLSVGGYFGILLLLLDALLQGDITVGAFAAVFHSLDRFYALMEELIGYHCAELAKELGSIRNYLRFLELEERQGDVDTAPGWGDRTLNHVSFTYPQTDKPAVHDVSLTLRKGETLAIVGENGSGKSTLVRLLSGLYPPDEGELLVNGIPAAALSFRALFAGTSAVFQRYQRYQMTLADNIAISDTAEPAAQAHLDEAAAMAGVDPTERAFPDGYETMLSREFDGVDLSGGQWQRVAIARGFFRKHHTIILDEPTAAIDPYEETRLYNRFAELAKDKSAVIVTHRLGSVRLADRIAVMREGRIVQIGTHDELIAEDGEYRRLYQSQEQWYREHISAES